MRRARIDPARLASRLGQLARLSEPGRGVTRLAFSPEDVAARSLVAGWAAEAGASVRVDAAGNLVAELEGGDPSAATLAPLSSGSHLDTVREGGPLDGAYGVVGAFEVLAALAEVGERLRHRYLAVAFANEEGVTAPAFTGSRAAAGLSVDTSTSGPGGTSLAERLAAAGGDPAGLAGAAFGPLGAYVELHVEQGPRLEHLEATIGAVSGIAGCRRGLVEIEGEAGHAGTTPMELRRDAALAAAEVVLAIDALARGGASRPASAEVATAGLLRSFPGNANVIAGRAEVSFDVRDLDGARLAAALERLAVELDAIAERTRCSIALRPSLESSPVLCRRELVALVQEAASRLGLSCVELASGAGHDAQQMALLGPMAMIFVPSIGGTSHHPDEATSSEHLLAGAEVLLETLRLADERLADGALGGGGLGGGGLGGGALGGGALGGGGLAGGRPGGGARSHGLGDEPAVGTVEPR